LLTPQDIQNKEFTKAVFGGYDMAGVDDFLEELTTDYAALYKENAVLKGKLKVLVEKVEEYRSTEDAMRMALLTAQNMSDDIMEEAKKKSDAIISEAESQADERKAALDRDYELEVKRLEAAKAETARFIAEARLVMEKYGEFLSRVSDMTDGFVPAAPVYEEVSYEEPAYEEVEETLEEVIARTVAEVTEEDAARTEPEESYEETDDPDNSPTRRIDWSEEDEVLTPRPKFKFDDLKFGKNYSED